MTEGYSDEVMDQLELKAREWFAGFTETVLFSDLTGAQQLWAEAVVEEFTQCMYAYHGRLPGDWTAKTAAECCVQTIPRKVTAEFPFFESMTPVLAAFFTFLKETRVLPNGDALARAVSRVAGKVVERAADPQAWGFAKSLLAGARAQGIDPGDPQKMEGFIDALNQGALPEGLPGFNLAEVSAAMEASEEVAGEGGKKSGRAARNKPGRKPAIGKSRHAKSPIHGLARRIARAMAKNRPPPKPEAFDAVLADDHESLFEILDALMDLWSPEGEVDEALLDAYLLLMRAQLEEVRFGLEREFAWARQTLERFKAEVTGRARFQDMAPQLLHAILGAFHEARLEPGAELLAVHEEVIRRTVVDSPPSEEAFDRLVADLIRDYRDDPFATAEVLDQFLRSMPADGRRPAIEAFGRSRVSEVADALTLLILNPEADVRQGTIRWLSARAGNISSVTLRRLIVMRNWIPPGDQSTLDTIIRTARRKGVVCAQQAGGEKVDKRLASTMDGAGGIGLLILSRPKKGRMRLSSVLSKRGVGVLDAWSGMELSVSAARARLREVRRGMDLAEVSGRFQEQVIRHHIREGLDGDRPPPMGLLQAAETLGAKGWQPERIDLRAQAETVIERVNLGTLMLDLDEGVLETSALWGVTPPTAGSWFLDHREVNDFLAHTRIRKPERLAARLLDDFFEPQRLEWAERFAWTALWRAEQTDIREGDSASLAQNFAILARALYEGRPLGEIPLMEALARRTIAIFKSGNPPA